MTKSSISLGDAQNYCIVEAAELSGQELHVFISVVGARSAEAELSYKGNFVRGRATAGYVAFDCPGTLDAHFSYAPGYTRVSLSPFLARSRTEGEMQQCEAPERCEALERCEAFFEAAVRSENNAVVTTTLLLSRRLQRIQALRVAWCRGDAAQLVHRLEEAREPALTTGVLRLLQQQRDPVLPARSLSRLLPLAQRLAQSSCESHALEAMRCVGHALQFSWPPVVRALRTVGTPKDLWEACEEVVAQVLALLSVVRKMSQSVRLSRSSGPLLPVCRRLRASLEEALTAAGRGPRK